MDTTIVLGKLHTSPLFRKGWSGILFSHPAAQEKTAVLKKENVFRKLNTYKGVGWEGREVGSKVGRNREVSRGLTM